MIQFIKEYWAIRSYVNGLSGELVRRFGRRDFYKIEHVTQAMKRAGYSRIHEAYAHAVFCSQEEFNAHYGAPTVLGNYINLRSIVGSRYLSGNSDFDAGTICSKFFPAKHGPGDYYESGIGIYGTRY